MIIQVLVVYLIYLTIISYSTIKLSILMYFTKHILQKEQNEITLINYLH